MPGRERTGRNDEALPGLRAEASAPAGTTRVIAVGSNPHLDPHVGDGPIRTRTFAPRPSGVPKSAPGYLQNTPPEFKTPLARLVLALEERPLGVAPRRNSGR